MDTTVKVTDKREQPWRRIAGTTLWPVGGPQTGDVASFADDEVVPKSDGSNQIIVQPVKHLYITYAFGPTYVRECASPTCIVS